MTDIHYKRNFSFYLRLLKPYKLIVFIIAISVLVTESLFIADKFLLKLFVDSAEKIVSGGATYASLGQLAVILSVIFFIVTIIRAAGKWIFLHFLNKLEIHIMQDVKMFFYKHILSLSHQFHTSHKTGSMIAKMIRGAGAVEEISDVFLMNLLPLIIQIIAVTLSLFFLDAYAALIVFVGVMAFILYCYTIQRLQVPSSIVHNDAEDSEKAYISDSFTNIESIKTFAKESYMAGIFRKVTTKTRLALAKYWNYYRWHDSGQGFVLGLVLLVLFVVSTIQFLHGRIQLGTMVYSFTVFTSLSGPLYSFVWGIRRFYKGMSDFESLLYYLEFENSIKDPVHPKKLTIRKGSVDFENVSFSYNRRKLFEDFSLKIPAQKKVAFVGHSGSGKSTLVKLLYRLYDVDSGVMSIDGISTKNVTQESLRSELSMVPQECVLFDDTIYNNVAFSRPSASKKEVIHALKMAQLYDVVMSMPKKENTIVGERGVKLSGGEKQRVSIARALLADKKVLVLDEATSSLDSETESKIQAALKVLMKGRTSIIIAHRLSTIMHADKIVVLQKGKIVQMGTHNQLIKQQGEYRKLWNLQKGGYIN